MKLQILDNFIEGDSDNESFEFSERRINSELLESSFQVPDDAMLKIIQ